jgi:hypothetical protein
VSAGRRHIDHGEATGLLQARFAALGPWNFPKILYNPMVPIVGQKNPASLFRLFFLTLNPWNFP